jgi:hypothetical protein
MRARQRAASAAWIGASGARIGGGTSLAVREGMPSIDTLGFAVLPPVLAVVLAIAAGAAARRAGPEDAMRIGGRLLVALAAWLALVAVLAGAGVFRRFDTPRIPLVAVTGLGIALVVARGAGVRRRLDAMPPWWPIAVQTMRVPIELFLWLGYERGVIPAQMTFAGRNLDILVGLTAPFVAWGVARGRLGARAILAWNLAGAALLVHIVVIAITSMPGPLQRPWGGVAPVVLAEPPHIWLPAFLVPLAALGHLAAVRAARRLR